MGKTRRKNYHKQSYKKAKFEREHAKQARNKLGTIALTRYAAPERLLSASAAAHYTAKRITPYTRIVFASEKGMTEVQNRYGNNVYVELGKLASRMTPEIPVHIDKIFYHKSEKVREAYRVGARLTDESTELLTKQNEEIADYLNLKYDFKIPNSIDINMFDDEASAQIVTQELSDSMQKSGNAILRFGKLDYDSHHFVLR